MRENAAIARTGMSEAGANQRAADNNALEAQRIGIAGQEAVFNRGVKGLDIQSAQRKQYIQSLMDAATTPEERKAIAERFPDVYAGDKGNKDNFMVVGGGQEWDTQAGMMRNVPQRLVDLRTVKEVGQDAGAATPTNEQMEKLRKNPDRAAEFDAKFGAGSAAAILGKPTPA